jgi:hypothetical protein
MRIRFAALWLLAVTTGAAAAPQTAAATPPFEITRDHVDVEVSPDGSYVASREEAYRVLEARGIELLHERKLAYTQDFEDLKIVAAYTLKANGQRINVPPESYLSGFGQSSPQGFQDNHLVSVFFPNLEVGDSVVLVTLHRQLIPWFAGRFDLRMDFSRAVSAHDVRYAITAPAAMALKIDAADLEGGAEETFGDKKRWIWQFHNDSPIEPEEDAVGESDYAPHLRLTSFADWADVARAYRERAKDRSAVTPEIAALADQLTQGVGDKRGQAKILYDWVSTHVAYVAIVLGAGGFTPHAAKDVLANRYGDCKDHVVLLEALLKAKGIDSTPGLIQAGTNVYSMPLSPSPHAFDHVITYLPTFDLYLDSTAQLAPFGVLPYSDTGKPVLRAATGELVRTPTPTSRNSTVRAVTEVALDADGSAQGQTKITASGAFGVEIRAFMQSIPSGKEDEIFHALLGPGAEGTLDRGNPMNLSEPFVAGATFHVPNAVAFPGPGALPFALSFKPFSFTRLLAGNLPSTRGTDYLCLSLSAEEVNKITLPPGVRLLSIPDPQTLTAENIRLQADYERTDSRTLNMTFSLKIDQPQQNCTPEYYARVRGALSKMANLLRQQVIYRGPREGEQ